MMNESTNSEGVKLPDQYDFSNSANTYLVEERHHLIPHCPHCGQFRPVLLEGSDYFAYFARGGKIAIFHYLTMAQRELLISGIHPECWAAFMGPEPEDDDD